MSKDTVHILVALLIGFTAGCAIISVAGGHSLAVMHHSVGMATQYHSTLISQSKSIQQMQAINYQGSSVVANAEAKPGGKPSVHHNLYDNKVPRRVIHTNAAMSEAGTPKQMMVQIPPHPMVKHWIAVLRNSLTPGPGVRAGIAELGRLLIYEAVRDFLPTIEGQVQSLNAANGVADVAMVDPSKPLKVVSILRSGSLLLEQAQQVLPFHETYHVGVMKEKTTRTPKTYLNELPETFSPEDRIIIPELTLATGSTIMLIMEELVNRGADPSNIRIVSLLATPFALQKLSESYAAAVVYTATIDEGLDSQGNIVPGLGDVVNRAYGTTGSSGPETWAQQ